MSPSKNIGFRRNIYLDWMEAAAAFSAEGDDARQLRARLDPVVAGRIASAENRRMALDILVNIWARSAETHPGIRRDALQLFAASAQVSDRLWLHYGMTLSTYDFFRHGAIAIGQLSRYQDGITPREIKKRLAAGLGQLGAIEKATDRILFSLRDWGILAETAQRYVYRPQRQQFAASTIALEVWLLTAVLTAHPAEELPFTDLLRLPEVFPFRFSLTVDDLRRVPNFEVHRQGLGWDMVRLA
jgi:hypothetical protein